MWRRRDAFALSLIVVACKRDAPVAIVVDAASPSAALPEASAPDAPLAIADASSEASTETYERQHLARVKSIGHTSVVLKLEMREGKKYAFKPRSKKGFSRYRGEIAAFRLAHVLGIAENVPKAYEGSFGRQELTAVADEKAAQIIADEVPDEVVQGAMIPWIDDYAVLPLENEKEWRGWLKKDGAIPDDKKDLAREISTMIAFDYITGNWDRWSGANVATSKGKLLYVDNDGAFFETPPKDGLARSKRYLEGVDRFSKAFVEKLRSVPEADFIAAIDLLPKKAIEGVLARRAEAMAIIAKRELYFP